MNQKGSRKTGSSSLSAPEGRPLRALITPVLPGANPMSRMDRDRLQRISDSLRSKGLEIGVRAFPSARRQDTRAGEGAAPVAEQHFDVEIYLLLWKDRAGDWHKAIADDLSARPENSGRAIVLARRGPWFLHRLPWFRGLPLADLPIRTLYWRKESEAIQITQHLAKNRAQFGRIPQRFRKPDAGRSMGRD